MGEQIKVMDMARHLIRLSGHVPDEDISVKVVGLRPGEKLREELVATDESLLPTTVEKILRVQSGRIPDVAFLMKRIAQLEQLAIKGKCDSVIELLCEIVPTFHPLTGNSARAATELCGKEKAPGALRIGA
jgi:FlaA1/EpsC-like NDP-sugar epimerase